jgi:excisionase family DNA binding protein
MSTELMSTREVADYLRIKERKVYDLLRARKIPCSRVTGKWLFPRDLLRLLGNPVGGAAEPLGRRHHPFGRILEGMAIHAARVIDDGGVPGELAIEWWSPTQGAEDFRIRSTVVERGDAGAITVHDIYEGERAVGTVRVTTRRRR